MVQHYSISENSTPQKPYLKTGQLQDNTMFAQFIDGELHYGEIVTAPDYVITEDTKDEFEFPHDGWEWFEDLESAKVHFGIASETPKDASLG